MRALTTDQIRVLAEELRGTCQDLSAVLRRDYNLDENDLSVEECMELDDIVLRCESCGWWEESILVSDGECDDCVDQRDMEEDDDEDETL